MKITKIELKNFRAFYGEHTIDLGKKGRNLIIYGENGSGKSSLLKAIELFIDSHVRNIAFSQHRNFFVTDTDGGHVKISMRSTHLAPETTYEWSDITRETNAQVIIDASKTKGSLDYKSLLEIYFLHPKDSEVDLFSLLIKTILANSINSLTQKRFSEEWAEIEQKKVPHSRHTRKIQELEDALNNFNNGLASILNQLRDQALDILQYFGYPVTIDLQFQGVTVDRANKCLIGNKVVLCVKFLNTDFLLPHQFLNEAKLSAISLAIYLAALQVNPPSALKVLVLDDVLIGLDMSNRLPVITILKNLFNDFHIFLMTYDKEWYEILKRHFPSWKTLELYAGHGTDYEMPILVENKQYLDKAIEYLLTNDHKAAAIYLRTAFEVKLKWFCEKMNLPIKYKEDTKKIPLNEFWETILKGNFIDENLKTDMGISLSYIMNPLSHTQLAIAPTGEIQAAIDTVKRLEEALDAIVKPPTQQQKDIDKARCFLLANEHNLSAQYLRSAFELKIKWFCEKMSLRVKYKEPTNKIPLKDFWDAIITEHYIDASLQSEIQTYHSYIMNRLSYAQLAIAPTGEIQAAIDTVERLERVLDMIVNPGNAP
ncbi:AAA family ATPase [Microcoleus sp. S36b_A4]|uniref:AAA family ATPase n=1 Tax=Microcoleus sp. S36b_A4 TaxID=3055420 RepID=UPI002FD687BB